MPQKFEDNTVLTGVERTFDRRDFIVSKTDLKGRITYANRLFMRLASMEERDLIGTPHSVIRHPEMPRCVFKLLWDTIEAKREIFAYVVNRSKGGDTTGSSRTSRPRLTRPGR
jgi:PAS domain-containing protein